MRLGKRFRSKCLRKRCKYRPRGSRGYRLFDLRLLVVMLGVAGLGLQAQLWLADDGYRKTLKLRQAVAEQRVLNESLRSRNAALDAEVINLKKGNDAAEERARTDLGMIGRQETFYQVVPADDAAR
ncbi:MAG: septum formation initiator family protein [Gammaproteobacteria bacterium]|nr:septum formation initiator family protein [Gammaproteobacteria bacterium]